jgi:hypothetical protein
MAECGREHDSVVEAVVPAVDEDIHTDDSDPDVSHYNRPGEVKV